MKSRYPLAAFCGQDDAVEAMLLLAVHPGIGGLILLGKKGSGKTTLFRSLEGLIQEQFVELPLNVTLDRLIGGLSLEETLLTGESQLQKGLLSRAKEGFLLVDNINFLSPGLRSLLLQTHEEKRLSVEREGISYHENLEFTLLANMNPEEGQLSPSQMDRFALCVSLADEKEVSTRREILKRALDFEIHPQDFLGEWEKKSRLLQERILQARDLLPKVHLTSDQLLYIGELVTQGGVQGHRGEIALCEASRALAALQGRIQVYEEDVIRAAHYALAHRLERPLELPPKEEALKEKQREADERLFSDESLLEREDFDLGQDKEETCLEKPEEIQGSVVLKPLEKNKSFGPGRRNTLLHTSERGREIGDKIPREKVRDLALGATLRAAALEHRESDKLIVAIKPEDLREKKKEASGGARILFLVDGSGSMGAYKRMKLVKGVVLSLLSDSYLKRDAVGVMVFRGNKAKLVLPLTRSIERAKRSFEELRTGGRTPLGIGIEEAAKLFRLDAIKHKNPAHLLVLVTDGKNNVTPMEMDSHDYIKRQAINYRKKGIKTIVIDTEQGFMRFGYAKELAELLHAQYLSIGDWTSETLKRGRILQIDIKP